MSTPGTSGATVRPSRPIWRRSDINASPAPGYCTLTATSAPVVPAALVHLADARRRGRAAVQPDELVLPVRAEALRDLVADGLGRHRRRGVLQPGELLAVGPGDLLGQRRLEHAQRLAELHRPALELAERPEELLGGPLLDVGQHRLRRRPAQSLAEPERACARRTRAAGPPVAPCAPRPCGEGHGRAWRHCPRPVHGGRRGRSTGTTQRRRYRQVRGPLDRRRDPRTHCPNAHCGTGVEAPPASSGRSVQVPVMCVAGSPA